MTFSKPVLALLEATDILGVRAGKAPHRFVALWVVLVGARAFVRSWSDKPGGWYRAFVAEPFAVIEAGERQLRVRTRKTRGERLLDTIDASYAAKYTTPGSRKYVRGFRTARRRATTLELLPR